MGDRMSNALLVMHSTPYYQLLGDNATAGDRLFQVADIAVRDGTPATGGNPVLVTDSDALLDVPGAATEFYTFGIVAGGINVTESEGRIMTQMTVQSEENIGTRLQGEHAFNLDIMGSAWDDAVGGTNPNAAAAGAPANWSNYVSSHKDNCGYLIESAAA